MSSKIVKNPDRASEPHRMDEQDRRRIVGLASREAEALIQQARTEAESLTRTALARANAEVEARVSECIAQLTEQVTQEAKAEVSRVLIAMEEEIVRLALAVAEKVCRTEIQSNRQVAVKVVEEGLAVMSRHGAALVRVNPIEMATVQARLAQGDMANKTITIEPDPAIEPGGAILDAGTHRVDAQVSTQLHHVRQQFTGKE